MENVYERAAMLKARELGLLNQARFAADVLGARDLGRRMDEAGSRRSFRLTSAYQSAMGTLERRGAALAKEGNGTPSDPALDRKRVVLARLRAQSSERTPSPEDLALAATVLPGEESHDDPLLGVTPAAPPSATPVPASNDRGVSDAAALHRLDPPPRSVADVRKRMGWGTARASAALRDYREEADRG